MTVKRTGTHFFTGILEKQFGAYTPIKSEGGVFYMTHCPPHQMDLILHRAEGRLLITTQRDWGAVERSWVNRGWDLEDFHLQREVWEQDVLPRADHVLSVDADDRVQRLAKLSDALGVSLETDWLPIN